MNWISLIWQLRLKLVTLLGASVKVRGLERWPLWEEIRGYSPSQQTPTDLLAKHGQAVGSSGKMCLKKGRTPQGEEEGTNCEKKQRGHKTSCEQEEEEMLQVPEQISLAALLKDPYCSKGKIWEGGNRERHCWVLTKITQPCDACSNGEEGGENLSLRKGDGKVVFKCFYFCFPLLELAIMFWGLVDWFFLVWVFFIFWNISVNFSKVESVLTVTGKWTPRLLTSEVFLLLLIFSPTSPRGWCEQASGGRLGVSQG